jgi:gliding motility-associated-like protein
LCTGQQYILKPSINTNANLLWKDGTSAPSFTVIKDGIYFLTATNECGSYTDSVTITTGFCDVIMPTGFTPNSDGINDVFKVRYPFPVKPTGFTPNSDGINDVFKVRYPFPVQQFLMVIYDRFGEKVFVTNDMGRGWDGTWKGAPCLQDTYVWVINFIDILNKQQQLKGIVTLLR